jgi:hypothetical protein
MGSILAHILGQSVIFVCLHQKVILIFNFTFKRNTNNIKRKTKKKMRLFMINTKTVLFDCSKGQTLPRFCDEVANCVTACFLLVVVPASFPSFD